MERLATTREVAEFLSVSPKTLTNWAYQGIGPKYTKVGNRRRYAWADVRNFVAERTVTR